jgi:hypothetical protein
VGTKLRVNAHNLSMSPNQKLFWILLLVAAIIWATTRPGFLH